MEVGDSNVFSPQNVLKEIIGRKEKQLMIEVELERTYERGE
jgi:hypothetical protein